MNIHLASVVFPSKLELREAGTYPQKGKTMGVEIREIAGFPGYGAGSDGSVWTRKPQQGGAGAGPWRPKAVRFSPKGYRMTGLCRGGRARTVRVCRAVAAAFHGLPPSPTSQVNHRNGNKSDDRPENLEWCTPAENIQHAVRTGLRRPSVVPLEAKGATKLTHQKASIIRHAALLGCDKKALAEAFGVDRSVISRVINGMAWDPFHS